MSEHLCKIFDGQMPALIDRRAPAPDLLRDDFRFGECLLQGYAWCKPRHDLHANGSPSDVAVPQVRIQNERSENVDVLVVRSQQARSLIFFYFIFEMGA